MPIEPSSTERAEDPLAGKWLGWALLVLIALITLASLTGLEASARWGSLFFLGAVLAYRAWDLAPCAILIFYLYVGGDWFPSWVWRVPAAPFLLPFLIAWLTCLPFPKLRGGFRWFRRGELDQISWLLVALVSLASALVLVLWALWTNYLGIAFAMMSSYKAMPIWFLLLVGIPVFALVNALAEEIIYRGVLQDALEQRFARYTWLVLAGQASAFAAAHYRGGFPNGKIGFAMTFTYACMLGMLRRRSNGMLAPYVAHVAADFVIGITLVLLAS